MLITNCGRLYKKIAVKYGYFHVFDLVLASLKRIDFQASRNTLEFWLLLFFFEFNGVNVDSFFFFLEDSKNFKSLPREFPRKLIDFQTTRNI